MTTVDYILIIIAVVIMVVGLYIIIRGVLSRKDNTNSQAIIRDKNGIPIIPRHERNLVEQSEPVQIEESETTITPDREHLQPVIEEEGAVPASNGFVETQPHQAATLEDYEQDAQYESANDYEAAQTTSQTMPFSNPLNTESAQDTTAETPTKTDLELAGLQIDDNEDDVFSTLASATEKLMPMIETAEETEFADNSPMLDHHLLAEADQDQNSPLNHAQENINITIVPKSNYELIDGKTILSIVNQYGLKYGAMNMFHRYEHKDGSGILWFSMMGIDQEGITPFDLNLLTTSKYNGLVLFLSLPHPKATQGFDTMMSVVNLIANDLNALILDENNEILTRERRQQLRTEVREYQAQAELR